MIQRIYIIAAEASADLHGSKLVHALKLQNPGLIFKGWGGQKLIDEGLQVDVRYEDANFMGFIEVIKNLPAIINLFKVTKKSVLEFKPDLILLIDYPGFNLRLAKWAFQKHIPVYYYISPQVWAWKENRVRQIKKYVRKLMVILPFEVEYFKRHQISAYYFGHPLMNYIKEFRINPHFRNINNLSNKSIIALLPGSRSQEIKLMLPLFLQSLKHECKHQIAIAGLPQHKNLYEEIQSLTSVKATIIYQDTYNLLANSRMALVTSGTATLETALFKVPQVVCYRGNPISYWLAKKLVKVPFISLVNLIIGSKVVHELIQDELNVQSLKSEITQLTNPYYRSAMIQSYKNLERLLYQPNSSTRIAEFIINDFTKHINQA